MSQEINSLKNLYRRKNIIIYSKREEMQETHRETEEKNINLFHNIIKITINLKQIKEELVLGQAGIDQFLFDLSQKEWNSLFLEGQ